MTPRELWRLSPRGRQIFLRTWLLVAAIRLGLWLLPFPTVQRLVLRASQRSRRAGPPLTSEQVDDRAWAVLRARRLVPRATCLTQALATQILLGRAGKESQLRLGVTRGGRGSLEAHAWLESDGRVVIGDEVLERYTTFPALE